ncbi:putative hemicentin-2 [Penaeus vannamei]|uniref:Putative hemicentin-2 n=1 Tax=Penaeus vannamei TaxID=6689 RepID=A0A3R7QH00_PENVA|nr:putative hemicentin-2 [Penaeus vannamei]
MSLSTSYNINSTFNHDGRKLEVDMGDDLGLTSTSTLLLNVTREEDGTKVVCTATNPAQPDTPLSNSTTLVVHCNSGALRQHPQKHNFHTVNWRFKPHHHCWNKPSSRATIVFMAHSFSPNSPQGGEGGDPGALRPQLLELGTMGTPGAVGASLAKRCLHKMYPPEVLASLGYSIDLEKLKEGDDVYFTCSVKANPPASTITWYHEDTVQVQNVSMGVILSGESLVLQRVSRQRAGHYRCSATNPLATCVSQPVRLRIRYKPECLTSPTTYFIYDKPINVTCTVSAYPSVSYIQWQWNNSNELTKTPPVTESREKVSSQLTVFPTEGREDRVLSCWAVNEMGKQVKPCGFSVKVARK